MSQPNRKAKDQKKHCHYQPIRKPDSYASCSSHASESIVSHPESSNVSKNTLLSETEPSSSCLVCSSTSAIPRHIKIEPSSFSQNQDTDSIVQSDTKSKASSSLPSKPVPFTSPLKTNTLKSGVLKTCISKNHSPVRTVPFSSSRSGIMPSLQWVAKSKPSEIPQCSKSESNSDSVTSSHPTPKIVSETSDGSRPRNPTVEAVSGCAQNKPPLDVSNEWQSLFHQKKNVSNESGETELNEPGQCEIEILKEIVGDTQRYDIPKHVRKMLRKNIVPPVLRTSLSPDNYAEYFATLLYAEDIYCQKWSKFLLRDVTINLRKRRKSKKKRSTDDLGVNYPYVEFKINEVRERRPFLLSRDYVHLVPSGEGNDVEAFNGVLSFVRNGTTILAEFKEDFHIQHEPSTKYDVSFSFNRICLKRAHRAVAASVKPLLTQILFPNPTSFPPLCNQIPPINPILNHELAPIPYLIEGRHSANMLIRIKEIILEIYKSDNKSRVLICASKNNICDALTRSIMVTVPKSDLFRANAAFREKEVPDDILPACRYDKYEECFTVPPSDELKKFRIILSTFVNTFGLHKSGLKSGHFSHIFLVDSSSAMEPEVLVALTDLVNEKTVIVATGSGLEKDKPKWVRSDIGREHGLRESFFTRLLESDPYRSDDSPFVTRVLEVAKSGPTRKTRPTRTRILPDPSFRKSQIRSNPTEFEPDIFFWSN